MYGDNDLKQKADRFYYMIFSDAARLAKAGIVNELWLTHYSQALTDPENYLSKVREIFKNAIVGIDRMTKLLEFEN